MMNLVKRELEAMVERIFEIKEELYDDNCSTNECDYQCSHCEYQGQLEKLDGAICKINSIIESIDN